MKKKWMAVVIAVVLVLTCTVTALVACKDDKVEAARRMTVDINPSVEFILDTDNKVVSVTGLNEDGSLLISGEAFVGKTAEDAAQLVVSLATQTGYLVKGEVTASDNGVTISISGDEAAAKKLYENVSKKVESFLDKSGINAAISQGKALAIDGLRNLVKKANPTLTDEQLAAMTEDQLIGELRIARVETALLLTEELREAYAYCRAYEIDFAEREATKNVIAGADSAYQTLKNKYSDLLASFQTAIRAVEMSRYNYLVDPESDYQKALANLLEKKAALIAQKNKVAALDEGLEKEAAKAILAAQELAYTASEEGLRGAGEIASAAIGSLVNSLQSVHTQLVELEKSFPAEINTLLTNKAQEIETAVNTAKNNAMDSFQAAHGEDIQAVIDALTARKAAMIEANKAA